VRITSGLEIFSNRRKISENTSKIRRKVQDVVGHALLVARILDLSASRQNLQSVTNFGSYPWCNDWIRPTDKCGGINKVFDCDPHREFL
jgi:hypothetical protein